MIDKLTAICKASNY
jgi:hypothetical protein